MYVYIVYVSSTARRRVVVPATSRGLATADGDDVRALLGQGRGADARVRVQGTRGTGRARARARGARGGAREARPRGIGKRARERLRNRRCDDDARAIDDDDDDDAGEETREVDARDDDDDDDDGTVKAKAIRANAEAKARRDANLARAVYRAFKSEDGEERANENPVARATLSGMSARNPLRGKSGGTRGYGGTVSYSGYSGLGARLGGVARGKE